MLSKYFTTLVFTVILLSSCRPSAIFDEEIEISDGIWKADQAAEFKVTIDDLKKPCDIFIEFENTKDFLSSNLWLGIRMISPSGKKQNERVEFVLTESNGKWLGKVNRNSVRNKFLYKNAVQFPEKGIYTFHIEQIMRNNFTPRALRVGLLIEESKSSDEKRQTNQ